MNIKHRLLPRLLAAGTAAVLTVSPTLAVTCAEGAVQARGEPSRFEVVAKAKARGNWRAHVRALPNLGPRYANWSIAVAASYDCSRGKEGHTCIARARPCRE
jgi:hypothetical protein